MSSKKKKQEPELPEDLYVPLMERPKFRLFYQITMYLLFSAGIILLVLTYSLPQFRENTNLQTYVMFGALGILGLGIILMTMRSSRKHSSPPEEEKEKDTDTLQMRTRR